LLMGFTSLRIEGSSKAPVFVVAGGRYRDFSISPDKKNAPRKVHLV